MIFIKTKNVWYWPHPIYLYPLALSWEDWDLFRAKIKKKYPAQYFFRETLPINLARFKYKIKYYFERVKHRARHPRKEMRDQVFVPCWQDLDIMFESFACEMVKEFVEKEDAFNNLSGCESKFKKELNKYYKYVKYERQKLIEEMRGLDEKEIETISLGNFKTKLIKKDDALLLWLVKNRKYFWT